MSEPVPIKEYEYAVAQIVTIAKFRKPRVLKMCDIHRYHVWIWRSREFLEHKDLRSHIPKGLKCQCGAIPA